MSARFDNCPLCGKAVVFYQTKLGGCAVCGSGHQVADISDKGSLLFYSNEFAAARDWNKKAREYVKNHTEDTE